MIFALKCSCSTLDIQLDFLVTTPKASAVFQYNETVCPGMFFIQNASNNINSNIFIRARPDKNSIICNDNDSVELYYNAARKLETIGTGVTVTGDLYANGDLYATTFVKSGGTSSQFLKADGSVDSSTYLTSVSTSSIPDNAVYVLFFPRSLSRKIPRILLCFGNRSEIFLSRIEVELIDTSPPFFHIEKTQSNQ